MAPDQRDSFEHKTVMAFVAGDSGTMARSGRHESQSSGSATSTLAQKPGRAPVPPTLETATSLPLPGTHVRDGLPGMVTGLSSPSFHNTLASPLKHGAAAASCCPAAAEAAAAAACSSAATAAATAAFARSMAWAVGSTAGCHALGDADGNDGVAGCVGGSAAAAAALLFHLDMHTEDGASPCCLCKHGPCCSGLCSAAQTLGSASAAGPPALSTKRGLYEGTVRGGSMRNTWLYLTTRTSAG